MVLWKACKRPSSTGTYPLTWRKPCIKSLQTRQKGDKFATTALVVEGGLQNGSRYAYIGCGMCHKLCSKSAGRMHDPSLTFTAAERKLHPVLRIMAAQHGGFKGETHIRREDRKNAVEVLRRIALKGAQTPPPRAAGAFVPAGSESETRPRVSGASPWDPLRKGYDKAALSDREAELGDLLKPDPPPGIPGWAWGIQASPNAKKWGKGNPELPIPFAKNYITTILGFTCIQVEATLRAYSKRGSPKSRMGVAEPPPAPDRERPGRRGTRTRASCTKISSSGR